MVCALLQFRHQNKYDAFPWQLFRLGDKRNSVDVVQTVARRFKAKNSCCVEFGLGRDLHAALSEGDLCSQKWRSFFHVASFEVHTSLANIERLHARNRATADPYMSWANFASSFIGKERDVFPM